MKATDFARNPIWLQMSQIPFPIIESALLQSTLLQHEVDDDREVDVHRLAVLQARLVLPLLYGRDRRLVEAELRAGGSQDGDIADGPVLVDDGLQDDLALYLRLAGDLWIGRLLLEDR